MGVVEEFSKIIATSDALMGENGCAWDHKQTYETLKTYLLEECYEVLEAVDGKDHTHLVEELGDLFYIVIFFAKIGEKEGHFSMEEIIAKVRNKLVYRHPHVFGEKKLHTEEAIKEQWDALKKKEKSDRKSKLDGIPKALPALQRAQKLAGLMDTVGEAREVLDEQQLGKLLFEIACAAKANKLNAEFALSKELDRQETLFRENEK